MKDGYVEKGYTPVKEDFDKIRQYTRKDFSEEELYVFSVTLCSNDVDRDYEKFSVSALYELAKLFEGKTGIKDHSMKSSDQTARIFETQVEKSEGRKTADGEDYYALRAKAYMVRNDENKSFITEIEAGIKKEVSVSCAMNSSVCSVCGKSRKGGACNHINGRKYGDKICFSILSDAADAYEWSFVAVPAQRDAGVTKSFNLKNGDFDMTDIKKSLITDENEIVLSNKQAKEICAYIEEREELAALGEEYKKSLVAGTGTAVNYTDLVKLWDALSPYNTTTLIAAPSALADMLSITEFKDSYAGQNFHGTGRMITPFGAEVLKMSGSADKKIIALDKNAALEKVQAGGVLTEYDKLIDRQLERCAITTITGFSTIFSDAAKTLAY